ncbi:CUE domain-containing protein [[Candida] zeylanoides]
MAKAHENLTVVPSEPVEVNDSKAAAESAKRAVNTSAAETDDKPDAEADAEPDSAPQVPAKDEAGSDDDAPPPPARPLSPTTRALGELKEAFPTIEEKYRTAVLIASSGQLEPAFNALLYLSDPTSKPEIPAASGQPPAGAAVPSTLTEDEKLARRLQQEFEREERQRRHRHRKRESPRPVPVDDYDSGDEFGQIKETFTQGLEEARTTLNGWVSGLAKKFSPEEDQGYPERPQRPHAQHRSSEPHARDARDAPASNQNPKLFGALGGSSYARKTSRFDEDPVILSNDFDSRISLNDNDNEAVPPLPRRKSQLAQPQPQTQSFDTAKKWQPLNADTPVNSDAFLVTDSEEESEDKRNK